MRFDLVGTATDPDNDVASERWIIDEGSVGEFTVVDNPARIALPRGAHVATYEVVDSRVRQARDVAAIEVGGSAPEAAIVGPTVVECATPAGATPHFTSEGSTDPDGVPLVAFRWRVGDPDGPVIATTPEADLPLPFGATKVYLDVENRCGDVAHASHQVSVVDTTPPQLVDFAYAGPVCLWAPNHGYVVLTVGTEFRGLVVDACDAAPVLAIAAASSSQPDNAPGDGDTVNDVVTFSDHVCIRAERAGNDRTGRLYEVHLEAQDRSGNASDPVVRIAVPHDQRPEDRCIDDATIVQEGDPRCAPEGAPPNENGAAAPEGTASSQVEPSSQGAAGCAASASNGPALSLAVFGAWLLSRSRRSRARGQWRQR